MEDKMKKETNGGNYCKLEGLLQTPELYQYILDTTVYPREHESLKELRAATADHPLVVMVAAPDSGQLISLLLKQSNAKKTIEIGVFSGYSLLLTALTIPQDGKVIAIDNDPSAYKEIGLPIIEKSGVAHKINFIQSDAIRALDKILENDEDVESFDFAFVDADKANNLNYHERLLKLVKPGEIIIYDNTLWAGSVALPEELALPKKKLLRNTVREFNKFLANDTRVDISLLPLGDGMMVCRRI